MPEKKRVWEGLRKHELDPDELIYDADSGSEGMARILARLNVGEYVEVRDLPAGETNTSIFQRDLEALRRQGIDVGKSNAEYGYRMPLPKDGEDKRYLVIFRRRAD